MSRRHGSCGRCGSFGAGDICCWVSFPAGIGCRCTCREAGGRILQTVSITNTPLTVVTLRVDPIRGAMHTKCTEMACSDGHPNCAVDGCAPPANCVAGRLCQSATLRTCQAWLP